MRVKFSIRLRTVLTRIPARLSFIFLLVQFSLLSLLLCDINSKKRSYKTTPSFHRHRRKSHHQSATIRVLLFLYLYVSGIVAGTTTTESIFHSATWDPGGGFDVLEHQFQQISIRVNPLLRNQRKVPSDQYNICRVWTRTSPEELCAKEPWVRFIAIRNISLFHDCPSETGNVHLGQLFRLEWDSIKYESDLITYTEHLREGIEGRDCITSKLGSAQCHTCYRRIGDALLQVNAAYRSFNRTLRRFDCMLATDSASATRPFSPNGTCVDCTMWYRKWILVQNVNLLKEKPCINWCYYAQQACPHMAPSKALDYAGHPSFQCRDLNIPQSSSFEIESCTCFHPCDVADPRDSSDCPKEPAYDFFPALEHCWAREHRCNKEKQRKNLNQQCEHAAFPTGATLSKAVSKPPLIPDDGTKSDSEHAHFAGKLAGYVEENPPENFNELRFVYHTRKGNRKNEFADSQQTNELT